MVFVLNEQRMQCAAQQLCQASTPLLRCFCVRGLSGLTSTVVHNAAWVNCAFTQAVHSSAALPGFDASLALFLRAGA
jgi:hypothetical protein